jgi:hypothetical protein
VPAARPASLALAALALLVALAAGLPAAASATSPHRTRITLCGGTHRVRPREIVLACADANWGVGHLRWHRWGTSRAHARGIAFVNTCTPNCAAGTIVRYRVRVVARGLVRGRNGARYTRLRMVAFRRPPAHMPRSATFRVTRHGPALTTP